MPPGCMQPVARIAEQRSVRGLAEEARRDVNQRRHKKVGRGLPVKAPAAIWPACHREMAQDEAASLGRDRPASAKSISTTSAVMIGHHTTSPSQAPSAP